jgi:hypothetical protein
VRGVSQSAGWGTPQTDALGTSNTGADIRGGGGFGDGFGGRFGCGDGGFRRFLQLDEPALKGVAQLTGGSYYRPSTPMGCSKSTSAGRAS